MIISPPASLFSSRVDLNSIMLFTATATGVIFVAAVIIIVVVAIVICHHQITTLRDFIRKAHYLTRYSIKAGLHCVVLRQFRI